MGNGSDHGVVGSPGKATVRHRRHAPKGASWAAYEKDPEKLGFVELFGHGKRWSGFLVGPNGWVLPMARRSLTHALASWRTGHELLVDERLVKVITDVSDEFGGRPLRIVSGYREHSYAPDSKHKVGQAFDFSIPGVPNAALRDYLRSVPDVGVGYYPNSTHVHVDVREREAYWVDYSAPGEHPRYSFDRRVAKWGPRERSLAAELDALPRRVLGVAPAESAPPPPLRAGPPTAAFAPAAEPSAPALAPSSIAALRSPRDESDRDP